MIRDRSNRFLGKSPAKYVKSNLNRASIQSVMNQMLFWTRGCPVCFLGQPYRRQVGSQSSTDTHKACQECTQQKTKSTYGYKCLLKDILVFFLYLLVKNHAILFEK